MRTPARRSAALLAAPVALALAACSSPYGSVSATPPPPTTTTIVGAATPALTLASGLRSKLTYLMVEHTFLLWRAVAEQAKAAGVPADDAAGALEANTKDLAGALGDAYGAAFSGQFGALWDARISAYEAYAAAKASGGDTKGAVTAIATASTNLATLLHGTNKFMEVHTVTNPATGIGDEFTSDDTVFSAMIDAAVTNDPTAYPKLATAAETMPHTAEIIGAATAKLFPNRYPGTPTGTAANLRASLTMLGVEHVELASLANSAVAAGHDAAPITAVVNNNTKEWHNAISAIYSDSAAGQFDDLWGGQLQSLSAYAKARQSGDAAGAAAAASQLDTFSINFGSFVSTVTAGKDSADTVSSALATEIKALEGVIDGAATNAGDLATRIRAATGAAPAWTTNFSEAIAEQFPAKYLP